MSYKGIDVSKHQGVIDWQKVKNQIDFAIIRASYSTVEDINFKRNITECNRLNIPLGVYVYSYALNESEAENEAKFLINLIKDYKIDLFVAIDMEDADGYKSRHGFPTNEMLQKICEIECDIFKQNAYTPFIYASKYWFDTYLNAQSLNSYGKWIAWWNDEAKFNTDVYKYWQHSSKGKISGINGNVDLDIGFEEITKPVEENFTGWYMSGKDYTLQVNLNVRTGSGTNFPIKKYNELTQDGKNHALNQTNAILKKGTIVTCKQVIQEGNNIWLRIPSGYVCAIYNGERYIK